MATGIIPKRSRRCLREHGKDATCKCPRRLSGLDLRSHPEGRKEMGGRAIRTRPLRPSPGVRTHRRECSTRASSPVPRARQCRRSEKLPRHGSTCARADRRAAATVGRSSLRRCAPIAARSRATSLSDFGALTLNELRDVDVQALIERLHGDSAARADHSQHRHRIAEPLSPPSPHGCEPLPRSRPARRGPNARRVRARARRDANARGSAQSRTGLCGRRRFLQACAWASCAR